MRSRWTRTLDVGLFATAALMTGAVVLRMIPAAASADGATRFDGWREDLVFDRVLGRDDAPYRLVVWTDYQCPACRRFEAQLDVARATLGDSLAVIYRYYPLTRHPLSFQAALAAECARNQGRFEQMHEALFEDPLDGDTLPLRTLAVNSGIPDTTSLTRCVSDSTSVARRAVILDRIRITSLPIRGTPALQIGDRIATGGLQAPVLIERLREAAARGR